MDGFDYRGYPIYTPQGPPVRAKKKVPIWNVLPGESQRFAPVQASIIKFGTHWIAEERRSVFCGGEDGGCMIPHDRQSYRWCGYVLAYLYEYHFNQCGRTALATGHKLLHLTPGAVMSCPKLDDATVDLSAYDIVAWRDGSTKRAEVKMELVDRRKRTLERSQFDVRAYLVDMYSAPNNAGRRAARAGDDS